MIDYEEEWLLPLLFKLEGSVYLRSSMFALPCTILAILLVLFRRTFPDITKDAGYDLDLESMSQSHLWSALTAVLVFTVAFRTRQGLARFWEGTGLLHQMKGEWFDTVSNCVTFTISTSRSGAKTKEVQNFRHTIVRLMSLCHGSALEEISGVSSNFETIDVLGLSSATLRHLKECVEVHRFNKVEALLHLVQSLITHAHWEGILDIPPPILSRVYQTISRGYVNLLNTKKITDTKFPFPYVQLITLLLFMHSVLTPVVVAYSIDSLILAPILTFVPVFGTHALNFIAMELEDPFGLDDNDLPLGHFQAEMNSCLLMLLHPNTDLIASISTRAVVDFDRLKNSVYASRGEDDDALLFQESMPVDKLKQKGNVNLFDPNFAVMGTNTSLEAVTTAHKASSESDSDDGEEEGDVILHQRVVVAPEQIGGDAQAGLVPNSMEPKMGLATGGNVVETIGVHRNTKELEQMLSQRMEEFNQSLHCWTRTMEEQVKDLSSRMCILNDLVDVQLPSHGARIRAPEGAHGQAPYDYDDDGGAFPNYYSSENPGPASALHRDVASLHQSQASGISMEFGKSSKRQISSQVNDVESLVGGTLHNSRV